MTDNEIIKTLECLCGGGDSCTECAYHKKYRFGECRKQVAKDTLDLINHQKAEYNNLLEQFHILDCECERLEKADENQKAEIERLKIENQSLRGAANSYKLHYNEARNEAVKEFAEKLNDRIINFPSVYPIENATLAFLNGSSHRQLEILEIIDNLVKELVGDTK